MHRNLMTRLLQQWKEQKDRQPLLLKGVRHVGKTYLLKEFGRLHFPQTHYVNLAERVPL